MAMQVFLVGWLLLLLLLLLLLPLPSLRRRWPQSAWAACSPACRRPVATTA
jgi:hypothetical protein